MNITMDRIHEIITAAGGKMKDSDLLRVLGVSMGPAANNHRTRVRAKYRMLAERGYAKISSPRREAWEFATLPRGWVESRIIEIIKPLPESHFCGLSTMVQDANRRRSAAAVHRVREFFSGRRMTSDQIAAIVGSDSRARDLIKNGRQRMKCIRIAAWENANIAVYEFGDPSTDVERPPADPKRKQERRKELRAARNAAKPKKHAAPAKPPKATKPAKPKSAQSAPRQVVTRTGRDKPIHTEYRPPAPRYASVFDYCSEKPYCG